MIVTLSSDWSLHSPANFSLSLTSHQHHMTIPTLTCWEQACMCDDIFWCSTHQHFHSFVCVQYYHSSYTLHISIYQFKALSAILHKFEDALRKASFLVTWKLNTERILLQQSLPSWYHSITWVQFSTSLETWDRLIRESVVSLLCIGRIIKRLTAESGGVWECRTRCKKEELSIVSCDTFVLRQCVGVDNLYGWAIAIEDSMSALDRARQKWKLDAAKAAELNGNGTEEKAKVGILFNLCMTEQDSISAIHQFASSLAQSPSSSSFSSSPPYFLAVAVTGARAALDVSIPFVHRGGFHRIPLLW